MQKIIKLLEIRNRHLILEYATKRYQNKDTKLLSGRLKENSWLLNKLKQGDINGTTTYLKSKVKHIEKMKAYTRELIEREK